MTNLLDKNELAYSDLIKFIKGIFATCNRGDRKPAAGHVIMFENSSGKIKEDRLLSSKNEVETPVLKIFARGLKREIFDNKDKDKPAKVKDIKTFEIFDGKWVRVRTDFKRKNNSSSALIDCLLPKNHLDNLKKLFDYLKGNCNEYDIEKKLEQII